MENSPIILRTAKFTSYVNILQEDANIREILLEYDGTIGKNIMHFAIRVQQTISKNASGDLQRIVGLKPGSLKSIVAAALKGWQLRGKLNSPQTDEILDWGGGIDPQYHEKQMNRLTETSPVGVEANPGRALWGKKEKRFLGYCCRAFAGTTFKDAELAEVFEKYSAEGRLQSVSREAILSQIRSLRHNGSIAKKPLQSTWKDLIGDELQEVILGMPPWMGYGRIFSYIKKQHKSLVSSVLTENHIRSFLKEKGVTQVDKRVVIRELHGPRIIELKAEGKTNREIAEILSGKEKNSPYIITESNIQSFLHS